MAKSEGCLALPPARKCYGTVRRSPDGGKVKSMRALSSKTNKYVYRWVPVVKRGNEYVKKEKKSKKSSSKPKKACKSYQKRNAKGRCVGRKPLTASDKVFASLKRSYAAGKYTTPRGEEAIKKVVYRIRRIRRMMRKSRIHLKSMKKRMLKEKNGQEFWDNWVRAEGVMRAYNEAKGYQNYKSDGGKRSFDSWVKGGKPKGTSSPKKAPKKASNKVKKSKKASKPAKKASKSPKPAKASPKVKKSRKSKKSSPKPAKASPKSTVAKRTRKSKK